MDKELVIIVQNEEAALAVVNALEGLDREGSIELYASTVVTKATNGEVSVKDTRHRHGPWGTVLGMSSGALIGLLGGPVGVAVGAAIGGTIGLTGDLIYTGFTGDFVYDVTLQLQPGSHAVCASVWEDWTIPVDVAVAPWSTVVMRQSSEEIAANQIRAENQALKDEWAHFEAEVAQAKSDTKAKLEAMRADLRTKQAAVRDRLRTRATKLQQSWAAKIASIKEKTAAAKAEAKARHQQHADKLARFTADQKEAFRDLVS